MNFFYERNRNADFHFHISQSLAFDAHIHESIEIVYLKQGAARAFVDGKQFNLCDGDFLVVFPNNIHYYDNCIDNLAIVVIVPLYMLPEFHSILTTKSLVSPLISDANPQIAKLLDILANYDGKYQNEAIRGILLTIFAMLLEKAPFCDEISSNKTTLKSILEFCENNYKEEISLQLVAEGLNISRSYISHIFTDTIGMNFRNYINSLRLNTAIQLLKQNELNITEIAYESGFETTRTFNRAFRKKFGVSPKEYKKKL